ncbi:glutamyl-tRNA(Gln) amidotransferase subunit C 1 [Marivirga tractuosa]|uniref:Aspartyl/glutamyl-tRNA(Asn/Gln) amidotransferase subunit C n=1 Tax=Marivirga tractuosa (strain ATCC 23168 / DSM 4126 / NBRC 15989 / NCIMB 1408 / VKM B-1430 / H-43) TaxID=643867 RepID=E4TMK6_MARTH|nr:Asp-tRNA(Asn)/Glu-tRNA(Gln) amidotransferase subunit GatC [Marivirga tractuosa]ADR23440.1 aspartyl/glutamyl-tRNA(Asn/Gln) amidotransferase subunit C [Marivirga tractuosa DSM 4126]BDD15883.1 glutamyl-tRNA(Gln) amidotransferase subunit C 1 [Marivirga tractuosa]
MSINKETLEKIAHLARLEFDEKSEEKMLKDMNNMLSFVEKLQELDTDNVEPLQAMSFEINQMREDKIKEHLSREKGLKNAPKKDQEYFRVPKVIE